MDAKSAYKIACEYEGRTKIYSCADIGTAYLFSFNGPESCCNPTAVYKESGIAIGWVPKKSDVTKWEELNVDDVAGENNGN